MQTISLKFFKKSIELQVLKISKPTTMSCWQNPIEFFAGERLGTVDLQCWITGDHFLETGSAISFYPIKSILVGIYSDPWSYYCQKF